MVDIYEKEIAPDPLMRNKMIRIIEDAIIKVANFIPSKKEIGALADKNCVKVSKVISRSYIWNNPWKWLSVYIKRSLLQIHYVVQKENAYARIKLKRSRNKEKESYGCVEGK